MKNLGRKAAAWMMTVMLLVGYVPNTFATGSVVSQPFKPGVTRNDSADSDNEGTDYVITYHNHEYGNGICGQDNHETIDQQAKLKYINDNYRVDITSLTFKESGFTLYEDSTFLSWDFFSGPGLSDIEAGAPATLRPSGVSQGTDAYMNIQKPNMVRYYRNLNDQDTSLYTETINPNNGGFNLVSLDQCAFTDIPNNIEFMGWNKNRNGDGKESMGGNWVNESTGIYYAIWEKFNVPVLQYRIGNASYIQDPNSAKNNGYGSFTYKILSPVATGMENEDRTKDFQNWIAGNKEYQINKTITINENTTLDATWRNKLTVTLKPNWAAGTGEVPADHEIMVGVDEDGKYSFNFPSSETCGFATRKGYTFVGWNVKMDGSGRSYVTDDSLDIAENAIYYATWLPPEVSGGVKGIFSIRKDGIEPAEPTHYPNSDYYRQIIINNALKKAYTINNNDAAVQANLLVQPSIAQIKAVVTTFDENTQYIRWYVIKLENDGWHIDGIVIDKAKFELIYSINGGQDNTRPATRTGLVAGTEVNIDFSFTNQAGETITPTRSGYQFQGWAESSNAATAKYTTDGLKRFVMPKSNVTLYAVWAKRSDINYTIEHYLQNSVGGADYTLHASNTGRGALDSTVEVSKITKLAVAGYQYDHSNCTDDQAVITVDNNDMGSLVIKLYYNRAQYNVTYAYENAPDGVASLPSDTQHYMDESVTVAAAPVVPGYVFSGWKTSDADVSNNQFTMPGTNVNFVGQFVSAKVGAKVEYYQQSIGSVGGYELQSNETIALNDVQTGDQVVLSEYSSKLFEGFTFMRGTDEKGSEVTQTRVKADGSTVLKLYYARNEYNVTYFKGEHGTLANSDADGKVIITKLQYNVNTPQAPVVTPENGFYFIGWNPVIANTVTANAIYTAQYSQKTRLEIIVADKAVGYNGVAQDGNTEVTYSGLRQGDKIEVVYTPAKGTNAGNYNNGEFGALVVRNSNNNDVTYQYNIFKQSGRLNISKLPVSITATAASKVYGTPDPIFANATISSFIGEELNNIDLMVVRSDAGNEGLGKHEKVLSIAQSVGALNAQFLNYSFTITPGDFEIKINENDLSFTAGNKELTYDSQEHGIDIPVTSPAGATIFYSTSDNGTYNLSESPTFKNVGIYTVYFKVSMDGYTSKQGSATVTIKKAPVTITVANASKEYMTADKNFENATLNGSFGDELDGIDLEVNRSDKSENVGHYALTISKTAADLNAVFTNYDFNVGTGDFEITPNSSAGLTVSAADVVKIYDGIAYGVAPSAILTGNNLLPAAQDLLNNVKILYKNADDNYTLSTCPVLTNVGTLKIDFQATLENFAPAYGTATVTINVRPIFITIGSDQKEYDGTALNTHGAVSGEISDANMGLAIGDTIGNITLANASRTDVGTSNPTLAANGLSIFNDTNEVTANYAVNATMDAELIVTRRALTVEIENGNKIYDSTALTVGARVTMGLLDGHNAIITLVNNSRADVGITQAAITDGSLQVLAGENDVTANYEIVNVTGGNITIEARPVAITVADAEKLYGTADPAFVAATMVGQVVGELGDINLAVSRNNPENNELGTYENVLVINKTLDELNRDYSNYNFTLNLGEFTIKSNNALTVSATGINRDYDGQNHGITPIASVGNTESSDATILYATSPSGEYTTTAPIFKNVIEQVVYIKATLHGYDDATCSVVVKIMPKLVPIKVADAGKVYQAANPSFAVDTVTGGIGTELAELANLEIIRRNPGQEEVAEYLNELTTKKTVAELNAEYTNYTFTVQDGIFTISNSGELGVSASNVNVIYDGEAHGVVATATVDGARITYKNADNNDYETTSPTITNVGSTTVEFKAELANYETAFGKATITVSALPVSITAMAASKVYATPDPTFAKAAISSFIGEELSNIDLAVIRSDAGNENLGEHEKVLSIAQSVEVLNAQYTNYRFNIIPANFMISANNTMTVSADDVTQTYDSNAYGVIPTANVEDAVITFMDAEGNYTLTQSPTQTNAGSITVNFKVTREGYTDAFGSATVEINPRAVTISAIANEKVYGDVDPEFGNASISGFIGAELANVNLAVSRSDNTNDDLGVHAGVLSIANTEQALNAQYTNYQFTVIPADFTIKLNQRDDLKVAAQSITKNYDGVSAGVAPTASIPDAVITYKDTDGVYTLTQSPTLSDVGNITVEFKATLYGYADAFGSATVTVKPQPVTIKAEASQKIYGSSDPSFNLATMTGNYIGQELIDGIDRTVIRSDATENPMSTAAADLAGNAVGKHKEVLGIQQTADVLNGLYTNYLITVLPADFDINENTTGLTARAENVRVMYDATAYGIVVEKSLEDATVLFADEDGTYTLTQSPVFTNSGTTTVKYQIVRTGFKTVTSSATVTIDQRPIRALIASAEKMYDGLALTVEWAIDSKQDAGNMGYASGDTIVSTTFNNDTLVDAGEITPALQNALFMNTKSENVTRNYILTSNQDAKVKITQRPVRIAIDSASKIYDGIALVATAQVDPTMDFGFNQGLVTGHSAAITIRDGQLLNIGTSKASMNTFNVLDQSRVDKTANYQVFTVGGDIEVTPRPIRVVIGSAQKGFDGQPLSVSGAVDQKQDEKNMGLVSGEKASIALYGDTRTDVGSNKVILTSLTIKSLAGQDTTGNYEIVSREGTLTINAVTTATTTTYTVQYFFNGVQDGNLTERLNGTIGGTITTYNAKAQNGMRFDHVDGLPLKLKADGRQNVISVYYENVGNLTLINELETPLAGSMACANVGDCVE